MTKRGRGQRRNRRAKNRSAIRWLSISSVRYFDEGREIDWSEIYLAFALTPRQMGLA